MYVYASRSASFSTSALSSSENPLKCVLKSKLLCGDVLLSVIRFKGCEGWKGVP